MGGASRLSKALSFKALDRHHRICPFRDNETWQKTSALTLLEMMHASKYQTVWAALALILLATAQSVSAFYIPGFTAVSYKDGQQVQLDVNKIFSKNAQLPYAYSELDFVCQPKGPVKRTWLNLGEILRGDRFVSSDFQVSFRATRVFVTQPAQVKPLIFIKKYDSSK